MAREMRAPSATFWIRVTGIAGILGAALWTLGDVLLIGAHASEADYPLILKTYASQVDTAKAATMVSSSPDRLAAGVLVADIGVVFYLAACWHWLYGLLPAGRRFARLAFALLMCGNAWAPLGHAVYYYVGMTYKTLPATPAAAHPALLELAAHFHQILVIAWVLPIVTLGVAYAVIGVRIAMGGTRWPRWFAAAANPLSLVAGGTAIALAAPEPVGTWLSGAAFNLGSLLVLSLSTALLWRPGSPAHELALRRTSAGPAGRPPTSRDHATELEGAQACPLCR